MKVSLAVAQFLRERGIRHVFCISGGASLHLIHGIADTKGIEYVCPQNEQAASFAADAYARLNGIGCALATSGPGATNLITGIATSYYDSIPVLYLTGNQTRERMNTFGTRQYGFQATPIVEMVKPVTKFAETVMDPQKVLSTLYEALHQMKSRRPGPALVDIPDDIQRAECQNPS
jgi:acetolactate synthase-1/2/3 large subunit